MEKLQKPVRVAIACQGGGAHTAFTAGVLNKILEQTRQPFEIVALSGTSGGAVCALFTWYGLSKNDPEMARKLLNGFWTDNSANSFMEKLWNLWALGAVRAPVEAKVSPYSPGLSWALDQALLQGDFMQKMLGFGDVGVFSSWSAFARSELEKYSLRGEFLDLKRLLEKHIDFSSLPRCLKKPRLLVGAVEVRTGEFKAFDSKIEPILPETILASAALPNLFKAVHIDNGVYWDGLFSQNPPVREFVKDVDLADKPDQIWVIQINPSKRDTEPTTVEEILDRRNELSGNVSLEQEIDFIKTLNKVVKATDELFKAHPEISASPAGDALRRYKTVKICRIEIDEQRLFSDRASGLDYASKLDRSPSFIQRLVEHGKSQAESFLDGWPESVDYEIYH